jgi:hypothetical protein
MTWLWVQEIGVLAIQLAIAYMRTSNSRSSWYQEAHQDRLASHLLRSMSEVSAKKSAIQNDPSQASDDWSCTNPEEVQHELG